MEYKLGSDEEVRDRYNSHFHQEVLQVLPEVLEKIKSRGRTFIIEEIDLGQVIGKSNCVVTRPNDTIVYAKRPKRWGYTRFVKNRQPEQSSSVAVILKKAEDGDFFIIITAFIGKIAEPEPWDRNATTISREFWNTHALVWGCEEIILGTEISHCPW